MRFHLAVLLVTSGLCACETLSEPIQGLAGASSMRVDVEVYKGPLANDVVTQWADLRGSAENAKSALRNVAHLYGPYIEDFRQRRPVLLTSRAPAQSPQGSGTQAAEGSNSPYTSIQQTIHDLTDNLDVFRDQPEATFLEPLILRHHGKNVSNAANISPELRRYTTIMFMISGVSFKASQMQAESQALLRELAVELPGDRQVRKAYAVLANSLCQYGNQISTRADALIREMGGLTPEQFSTGAIIRNTKPCATLDALIWFSAFDSPLIPDVVSDPVAGIGADERRDRVRALERLFADLNWSHVNTVYAAGQGKTTMALIRDQYGNWDLKAFENDPSELLQAYTSVARAALDTAVSAVKGGVGDPTQIAKLLDVAKAAEAGESSQPAGQPVSPAMIVGARRFLVEQLRTVSASNLSATEMTDAAIRILNDYKLLIQQLQIGVARTVTAPP
jgi:hypothetical protein